MAITSSYLVAVSKLGDLLTSVRNAQAPDRFTIRFLESLGYKTTNDRLFISLLKALGFLDPNGVPKQRYFDYLDETQSGQVLAQGIRDAYEDLFRVNKNAHTMSSKQIKSKLKSLTQGQHSESVLNNMSRTFVELVKFADFEPKAEEIGPASQAASHVDETDRGETEVAAEEEPAPIKRKRLIDSVTYRIEVTLPISRDKAVYDAIFRSVKEHLL